MLEKWIICGEICCFIYIFIFLSIALRHYFGRALYKCNDWIAFAIDLISSAESISMVHFGKIFEKMDTFLKVGELCILFDFFYSSNVELKQILPMTNAFS